MGVIDIVIVCFFLPALFFGIKNGMVKQLVALAVIYFGIVLSLRFATPVSQWVLEHVKMTEFWAKAVSFILIFFAVALVLSLFGRIIEKIIKITLLGWLNKLLGVAFGLLVTALILGVVIVLFDTVNIRFGLVKGDILDNSLLYGAVKDFAYFVFPYLKELLLKQ